MAHIVIKKGHDLRIAGKPARDVVVADPPRQVALHPSEFRYVKPKMLVKEGDRVQRGTPLFFDKLDDRIRWASPAGGTVVNIERGPRRRLDAIVIELESEESVVEGTAYPPEQLASLERDKTVGILLEAGLWPFIRQRPFGKIASPDDHPKCILISAALTAPLSPNPELVLEGNTRAFQAGLDVLSTLTEGTVHLVRQVETRSEALSQAQHCTTHSVEGPHPAGNVGVLLHHLDPLRPGEVVWTVTLQHVIQLGTFFLTGRLDPTLLVSVAGPGVSAPVHVKTRMGVSLAFLTKDRLHPGEMRFISGDVLTGTARDREEFLGYYDTICSVIPVSHERPFLGWLRLGSPRTKYTLSRAYRGSRRGEFPFTTLQNGDRRAMVPIGAWEKVLPMDIWPNPLYRAIQANDIDEMENLGLLELVEEDVALCSFACPSKIDLGAAVRKGLDVLYQEG